MTNEELDLAEGTCSPLAARHAPSCEPDDARARLLNPSLTNVLFMALHARAHAGEALPELASARLAAIPNFSGA